MRSPVTVLPILCLAACGAEAGPTAPAPDYVLGPERFRVVPLDALIERSQMLPGTVERLTISGSHADPTPELYTQVAADVRALDENLPFPVVAAIDWDFRALLVTFFDDELGERILNSPEFAALTEQIDGRRRAWCCDAIVEVRPGRWLPAIMARYETLFAELGGEVDVDSHIYMDQGSCYDLGNDVPGACGASRPGTCMALNSDGSRLYAVYPNFTRRPDTAYVYRIQDGVATRLEFKDQVTDFERERCKTFLPLIGL